MKAWTIEQLRRATKSKWLQRPIEGEGHPFSGRICTNSKEAKEGDLFIAIRGKTHDAHAYVRQVIAAKVAAVLVHHEPTAEELTEAKNNQVVILLTDDTVAGLNRLAAAYRSEIRAKVIAVGGSNGKTTTKRIIHSLLREKYGPQGGHASPKSFNNNIGMPLTMLEVEPSHEYVVLEIGTNAPGEIAALGEVARPDIAVITNVGLEHLEQLRDLAGVAQEEASIAPFVQTGGTIILPAEAPELLASLKHTKALLFTVGRAGSAVQADMQVTDVSETVHGVTFTLNGRGGYRLPLLGEHNAVNALLAIAVARRLGLNEEQIQAGLNQVKPAPMRLELMEVAGHVVINDAYNANPSSMAAALATFGKLTLGSKASRRVAILGDMLELGTSSQGMHREIGEIIAKRKISVFVAVGPAMAFAADTAEAAGVKVYRFADTKAACAGIREIIQPDDVILLKGSRGMALEKILEAWRTQPSVNV